MTVRNALVHEFDATGLPQFDEEGDQMIGYYYQFTDDDDQPVGALIGPYSHKGHAERAAKRAFARRDF